MNHVRRIDTPLVIARIAEAAIRRAAGLKYSLDTIPQSLRAAAEATVEEISGELAVTDSRGILRCGLCGKGPFTRKGLYLHLRRVHIDVVEQIAKRVFEEKLWQAKTREEAATTPV